MIGEILLATMMTFFTPMDCDTSIDLGECRITEYCPYCNEPHGHDSATGVYLSEGHAACNWLPMGTVIEIDGRTYEIVDVCGTDAIDLFRESDSCQCNLNDYAQVKIIKE